MTAERNGLCRADSRHRREYGLTPFRLGGPSPVASDQPRTSWKRTAVYQMVADFPTEGAAGTIAAGCGLYSSPE